MGKLLQFRTKVDEGIKTLRKSYSKKQVEAIKKELEKDELEDVATESLGKPPDSPKDPDSIP